MATTIGVGELKPHFSAVLDEVRLGKEFIISYGRKKEKVAVMIPYDKYRKNQLKNRDIIVEADAVVEDNHALDEFIGSWVDDPEFDGAIKSFDIIDEELWR
jgi:antitoxin (DNA-binding transcriptional repressor) of toxin-antitoxin stability system